MKFNFLPLAIASFGLINSNQVSADEEIIHGVKVTKYSVDKALDNMLKPPFDNGTPAHFQYIIGLDQAGAMIEGTGMSMADPEYAVTLSSGTFDGNKQKINRCIGGGWNLLYLDSKEYGEGKVLSATGKDFLGQISDDDEQCHLTFTWNDDFTEADISGYFYALTDERWVELATGFLIGFTIELQPYWRWKFDGLQNEPKKKWFSKPEPVDTSVFEELDSKCCPRRKHDCSGENVLGKEGDCETISLACGPIDEANLGDCVFYKRRNLNGVTGGELPKKLPFYLGYNIFPLMDKYGMKTSYEKYYKEAIKAKGVTTVFHGLERVNEEL